MNVNGMFHMKQMMRRREAHVNNRDRKRKACSLSREKGKPIRNRKGKKRFGCGVSFVIGASCGVALVDSEARGTAPSEVVSSFVLFLSQG